MFQKFSFLLVLSAFLLILPVTGFAQDSSVVLDKEDGVKVRPFRIGVKIGFPNIIGGNLEYVLPVLGKKVALTADYSAIKSDWLVETDETGEDGQDEINYTYMDLGVNYYIFKPGKGLYAGIGYNTIKIEATTKSSESVEYIKEKHGSVDIKLGAKLGGLFYFRPEVGYSFDPLPKKYDVRTVYNDGTEETRTYDWSGLSGPADLLFKGLMANIGIGFAF